MGNGFTYDKSVSINSLSDLLENVPVNEVIGDNLVKAWSIINNPNINKIVCSISGGSDSDIVLDICCRCDKDKKIEYVFFGTGLEYQATKDHLLFLEDKYGIKIHVYEAWKYGKTIPTCCKEYGQPFLSKKISDNIMRLQAHDFKFEDKPFEELILEYPKCKSALRWWCNEWGDGSSFNISRNKYLKEFMVENPPDFMISNKCCTYAKKNIAHHVKDEYDSDLSIYGVRKAEGGARAQAYKNCYTCDDNKHEYRPIFWYKDSDKRCYEEFYGIIHSKCYTEYGLTRTGCVGCPYGLRLEQELAVVKEFEPKLYKAVCNVFKDSYEYTRKYKQFRKQKEGKKNECNTSIHFTQQMSIFDFIDQ